MNTENRLILLKDLSARIPYKPWILINDVTIHTDSYVRLLEPHILESFINGNVRITPYLRPMSSMTLSEKIDYQSIREKWWTNGVYSLADSVDWLNANHFDHRNLIEKGLALEAIEDMYNCIEKEI